MTTVDWCGLRPALPDLHGKTALVTGASSGIGFHTALELCRSGASVVLCCRDAAKGDAAVQSIRQQVPEASVTLELVDLANMESIRTMAARWLPQENDIGEEGVGLDLLVLNAGVMLTSGARQVTSDGFELAIGTNHLGHFLLTALLLPALRRRVQFGPRVVVVSSMMAARGKLVLENLQAEKGYSAAGAYANSKLANLLFVRELSRRVPWISVTAAHPGYTSTALSQRSFPLMTRILGQPAAQGALPTLRACVETVPSGAFFGPNGWFNLRGAPVRVDLPAAAKDDSLAAKLWSLSEQLTSSSF